MLDTRSALKKFNIKPTKSLGQNFLKDDGIIKTIVDSAEINVNDLVIEVGPGLGSMTAELASRAGKVVAVEIDRQLIPVLKENLQGYSNVEIIQKDILKVDLRTEVPDVSDLIEKKYGGKKLKVVANLPYYITTPVIMRLLEQELPISNMVFMVQAEVADRMAAEPGGKEYGALSVAVQYYSKPKKLFNVSPESFIPQPGVESTVIKLEVYEVPPVHVENRDLYFKTVKAAFGQRRKTLVNALHNSGFFNISKEDIKEVLNKINISENQRGETLSIYQFAELANKLR